VQEGKHNLNNTLFTKILTTELISALGCTEPIAVALAASKAGETLGRLPEKVELSSRMLKESLFPIQEAESVSKLQPPWGLLVAVLIKALKFWRVCPRNN
jgi:L-cysteine desulfidase